MSTAKTKAAYVGASRQRVRNRSGPLAPEPRVEQYLRRKYRICNENPKGLCCHFANTRPIVTDAALEEHHPARVPEGRGLLAVAHPDQTQA
jgi:hypothetical protein